MSFVTLTFYKLDNLWNQLMNNRLLASTLYSACQLSVPCRPANATSSANGRVNSVEVRSAHNQTDPLEWMTDLVEKKKATLSVWQDWRGQSDPAGQFWQYCWEPMDFATRAARSMGVPKLLEYRISYQVSYDKWNTWNVWNTSIYEILHI